MKTKTMKTKTKTIFSVCILSIFLYACSKDNPTPNPVSGCMDATANNYDAAATIDDGSCTYAFTDCNGVQNGTSMLDDCDDCQQAYIYNPVTHAVVLLDDTSGVVAPIGEMIIMPNDPMNPYWNANCTDCDGILNGVAVVDSCGDCQGAYIYNMVTHDPSEIVILGGDTTGASATLTAGQVIILPEDPGNPYWNAGCK